MTIIHSTDQISVWRSQNDSASIALVPTMGALHRGHEALIAQATKECELVVVSLFVNALQFGDATDFDQYPRSLESDYQASMAAGAHIVFAPTHAEIFPPQFDQYLEPSHIADDYEGASRPGHFAGVVTVVNRLFNIVQPHIAVFGAKDYQQVAVIGAMSAKIHPVIQIRLVDTVRDTDGLALSSRNIRLSREDRTRARVIPSALQAIQRLNAEGQTNCSVLQQAAIDILAQEPTLTVEYVAIVNQQTLRPQIDSRGTVALFAGTIGGVRLIDNVLLA